MHHVRFAIASVLSACAVLGGARPASADDKVKSQWDGFGVGSYVHQKTTSKMTGPGMPEMPAQESESKMTLVKVTDDAYIVKAESKVGDQWMGTEMPFPRKATGEGTDTKGPKVEELGEEKVSVDGTDVACKKTRTVSGDTTTTSWTNEKYGLVKSETTGASKMTIVLTKLSAKVKAGKTELDCRELTMTTDTSGVKMTGKTWTSDAIPGGSVRSEMTTDMPGGMKTVSTTETIAFEKK